MIALSTDFFRFFPGVPLNEGVERRQRWTCRRVERGVEEKSCGEVKRHGKKHKQWMKQRTNLQSRVKSQPLSCKIGERNLSYMLYVLEVVDHIYIYIYIIL